METLRDLDLVRAVPPGLTMALRAEGDATEDDGNTLVVRFSKFDVWYEIDSFWEGQFLERTIAGAFKRTIKNNGDQVKCLYDHGYDPQIGNKVLGAIESLSEESDGPVGEVPLFDTSYNRDLIPGLRAGVYGSSFRFRVIRDEWNDEPGESEHNPKGLPERTIKEVRLFEFGPVTFPANPDSTAGMRSLTDSYYERVRSRDPEKVDELLARARSARGATPPVIAPTTSRTPDTGPAELGTPEDGPATPEASDPAERHSDAPKEPAAPAGPARTQAKETAPMDVLTVEERVARQSEIRARLTEIDTEHSGAALPEDIRAEWDQLNAEHDEHDVAIRDAQARADRIRALADKPGTVERGAESRTTTGRRTVENIYDLAEVRRQARSLDELPQLYRDNAMRAIESARFPGAGNREDAQRNVERLLDTVDDKEGTLARRILVTGSPVYERAFGKYCKALSTNGLSAEEQRALAIGAGSTGGFAVPFQLDPTVILTSNGSTNPLRQISRVEQIVGKEWQGITSAGVTVSRAAEAAQASDNSPTLAQPAVKAERVQGFIPFSIEVDQDWTALQSEMTKLLADAKDTEEATSFVTGDGVSPNANGLIATLNASSNVVANTFSVGGIYALEDALPDRFLDNARFLAHRSIYNLARQFDTAGGANLWVRLGEGLPPELIGYPAHKTSAMADGTLTVGDRYLLLGDFRNFLIVDRVGMTVDVIPHLFGANQRPTGQRGLYAFWRNNSKILTDNAFRVLHKAA